MPRVETLRKPFTLCTWDEVIALVQKSRAMRNAYVYERPKAVKKKAAARSTKGGQKKPPRQKKLSKAISQLTPEQARALLAQLEGPTTNGGDKE